MSDTNSCASGSHDGSEIVVENEEDVSVNIENDTGFQDAIAKLDELNLEPDKNMPEMPADEVQEPDDLSVGAASTGSQKSDKSTDSGQNGAGAAKSSDVKKDKKDTKKREGKDGQASKKMSFFEKLKKMTKFDKEYRSNFTQFKGVKIDRLPQCFVAKYLGKREVKGVYGLQHVRAPVDEMVAKVRDELKESERVTLPLVYMVFSAKGLDIRRHKANTEDAGIDYGLIPLDFISYGVQDIKYWRVFTFIVVNELSLRTKKMECHALICDSTQNARRMALALGACFQIYKRKLTAEGKAHNFQVELRPPDEITAELSKDFEA